MTKSGTQGSVRSVGGVEIGRASQHHGLRNDSTEHKISPSRAAPKTRHAANTHTFKSSREEIARIREQIISSRLDLREQRVEMRQQHELVRSIEAQLLQRWQVNEGSDDPVTISHLHGELCAALDKLGPMEQDYDEKEDGLDTLEFDLEVKEKRFYKHYGPESDDESYGSPSTHRTSLSSLSDISPIKLDTQDLLSPHYQYYSRVGDAKIVRERMMELEAQKDQYLDIERERDALSIPLYQENIDFLSNYKSEYNEQKEELEKIEKDIYDLGFRAGFFSPNSLSDAVSTPIVGDDVDLRAEQRRKSPVTEPGRIERSGASVEEPARRKSEADVWSIPDDPRSIRERINQWILERLGHSRIEKARHKAILNDPRLTEVAWWNLVQEFWQHDRAARSSPSSSRHASGHSSSVPRETLYGSLEVSLDEASDIAHSFGEGYSTTDEGLPTTSFSWHGGATEDRAKSSSDRLKYLDLAATVVLPGRPEGEWEKWDDISGC
ncbi:MAG: hypothetical protein Q9208_001555 [Pyrenodesmia sp. 3 TL-2023]